MATLPCVHREAASWKARQVPGTWRAVFGLREHWSWSAADRLRPIGVPAENVPATVPGVPGGGGGGPTLPRCLSSGADGSQRDRARVCDHGGDGS